MSGADAGPPRPIRRGDLPDILALNAAHEAQTSPLTERRLAAMVGAASVALTAPEPADGFLLAYFEGDAYDGANFAWFRARRPRFAYVDRIVVADNARRRGLASRFYGALFAAAADSGRDLVCCEINSRPPNPRSDAFHAARGFFQVGAAELDGGAKAVRYMARRLRLDPAQRAAQARLRLGAL